MRFIMFENREDWVRGRSESTKHVVYLAVLSPRVLLSMRYLFNCERMFGKLMDGEVRVVTINWMFDLRNKLW